MTDKSRVEASDLNTELTADEVIEKLSQQVRSLESQLGTLVFKIEELQAQLDEAKRYRDYEYTRAENMAEKYDTTWHALDEARGALRELQRFGSPGHPEQACWCDAQKPHSPGCLAAKAALGKGERREAPYRGWCENGHEKGQRGCMLCEDF